MTTPIQPVTYRKLNPLGALFSQLRHVWPHDRFLWPAAEILTRVSGLKAERGPWETAEGYRLELDPRHYPDGAMLYGTYEIATVRLVSRLLRQGDLVLDIGANIGFFSIRFSRLVGDTGQVISFEPVPTTLARLRRNIAENGCANVTIRAVALTNTAGPVTIHETASHGIAGLRALSGQTTPHAAEGARLDDDLKAERRVRLIKMDVEGAERLVLQGAQALIARDRPHIVLEKSSPALAAFGYSFADVAAEITRHGGYRVTSVDRGEDLTNAPAELLNAARDGNFHFAPG